MARIRYSLFISPKNKENETTYNQNHNQNNQTDCHNKNTQLEFLAMNKTFL